jgi:tRNA(Arg) A34 adenosine deaminase TadA
MGPCHPLEAFNTYDWHPHSTLSDDENYMDLTLLVTRSSKLKHGSMACILVQNPLGEDSVERSLEYFTNRIVSVANNQAFYKENESDIHAEIAAIGQAASRGQVTKDCTAYITMPPCRNCFGALFCAGVQRIVSRHESRLLEFAMPLGIEMVHLPDKDGQRLRTQAFVQAYEEQTLGER